MSLKRKIMSLVRFPADVAMQLFILHDDCFQSTGGAGDIDTKGAKAIYFGTTCNITVGSGTVQSLIPAGSCFAVEADKITVDTDVIYAIM